METMQVGRSERSAFHLFPPLLSLYDSSRTSWTTGPGCCSARPDPAQVVETGLSSFFPSEGAKKIEPW